MGATVTSLPERIVKKIRLEGECWIWTSTIAPNGYGKVHQIVNGEYKQRLAHRAVYELLVGPIPEGLTLDHLCRVKACVNPAHLEAVSSRENTLRSESAPATINFRKTHCKNGHEFTPENTYIRPTGRSCRKCFYLAVKRRRATAEGQEEHRRWERERARRKKLTD